MSGKDLYEKLVSLGYLSYASDIKLPESLKPTPKSLDWLFAFPKNKSLLKWLLEDLPESQYFTYAELEKYNNLNPKLLYTQLQDISELIKPEGFMESLLDSNESIEVELESIIAQQESEIKSLECMIKNEYNTELDIKSLELCVQKNIELLEKDVLGHLNSFGDAYPVISLITVQSFSKLDEEVNSYINNYAKLIDQALDAIDVSVYQKCLRSDRAQEFSDLCQEKKRLEVFAINSYKQKILARAAHEKYKSAMIAFEETVLKEDKLKKTGKIQDIVPKNQAENLEIDTEINATLQMIQKTTTEIDEINVELIEFQNIDIIIKKDEFRKLKLKEIQKIIEYQQKQNLLGLSCIVIEQEEVQQEYDRLFRVQSFFEDLTSQIDFRINYYNNFKLKAEVLSEDKKIIDERDDFMNNIYKAVSKDTHKPLLYDKLIATLETTIEKASDNLAKRQQYLQNFIKDSNQQLSEFKTILKILQTSQNPEESLKNASIISQEINKLELNLQSSLEKFETINKNILTSASGINEREIFTQYLKSPDPEFLKECDAIQ